MNTDACKEVIKFRVAQKVFLFNKDGKVLITRFSSTERIHEGLWGKWDFPGGGLEYGENLRRGLLREIREELGDVKVRIGKPLVIWDWIHAGDATTRTVCIGFEGEYLGGEVKLNEEHDEYE